MTNFYPLNFRHGLTERSALSPRFVHLFLYPLFKVIAVLMMIAFFGVPFSSAQTTDLVQQPKQQTDDLKSITTEKILSRLAALSINRHIVPRYEALYDQSLKLQSNLGHFCKAPNDTALLNVKQDFAGTVLAFAAIEHIHFGPIVENYRLERLAYWPDRKGRGTRAIRRLIKAKKPSSIQAKRFAKKSIAVQGLTALEYVLYGPGHEKILNSDEAGQFRCHYAEMISLNIANIMKAVVSGWQKDTELVTSLTAPRPSNKHYRNRKEVILEFYQSITVGLKTLHDARMQLPLGRSGKRSKPKRAAFWRSGLALQVLRANLEAIDHIVAVSGFEQVLSRTPVDLQFHVRKIFKELYGVFVAWDKADLTIAKVVSQPESQAAYMKMAKNINHLNVGFSRYFAIAADLPLGFNASDGD